MFRTRQENPSAFQDRLEEIGLIFGDEELARQLSLLDEYTRKQTAPAEASGSSPAEAAAAQQASAADVARSQPTCSPDPEQLETTALLFRTRQENLNAFQDRLEEIGLIFGEEELARQLDLLEDYTGKQTAPAEASGSSPAEAAAAQQARPADVSPDRSERAKRSPRWALTIKPQWCRKILDGSKVWEIRGQNCRKHLHERICIAESGTGMLLGEMNIRDSFKITREDLEANRHLHGIEDLRIITYGNIYAWVLENVEAYEEPVPYSRSAGSIAWVDLHPAAGEEACQNPDCCFGATKKDIRGKAFARARDEVRFHHCVFCSEEAFRAALEERFGRPIKRLLGQLKRTSADRHGRALEQIRQHHGPEMAERFAPKQPTERARKSGGRKKSVTSWETSLEYRQPTLRASETARRAFEITEQRADARLERKFPSLYSEGARSAKEWMPPRAAAFHKWCQEDSWQMCSCCGRMVPHAFRAKHATGKASTTSELAACGHCKSNGSTGYWAPTPADVPRRLRKLSAEAVEALRPFDIHTGGTMRAPNGYLVHNDMMRFSFKTTAVENSIAKLPRKQRERAEKALEYLLRDDSGSYYGRFWQLHHKSLRKRENAIRRGEIWAGTPAKRLPTTFIETIGIECALWPHLYWCVDMTETYVRSQDARRLQRRRREGEDNSEEDLNADDPQPQTASRQSAKASFLAKVHSAVIGYNSDPLLLHFVYDLWLFTTIGGAKNSAGTGNVREALATKPYSPELWRTYHTALVDLQRQIGWPSLFITIAPYEWSFPYHRWLQDELRKSLLARLEMPVPETLHLAHVLTQAVKGLLTGANEGMQAKREHLFCSREGPGKVRHWVARLEFQDGKRKRHVYRDGQFYHGRGTVHVHILLWLSDMQAMNLSSKIRADVPGEEEPELRDLVVGSQLDYTSSGWPLREEPTEVAEEEQRLRLYHPREALERNCRAYLPDILAALRCHVDVQASDGRAMILKYCASVLSVS